MGEAIDNPDYFLTVDGLELAPSMLEGIVGSKYGEFLTKFVTYQQVDNAVPVAKGVADARAAADSVAGFDETYCINALITKFSHLDEVGKKHPFTSSSAWMPGQDVKVFKLGNPESRNVFRLEVATLTADADNSDMAVKGRPDRVNIQLYQPNIQYTTSLILKVLEESDNPLRLLRNRDMLDKKVMEIYDMDMMFSLIMSERFVTDSDGTITKDIVIPDDWLPAPIMVFVTYGYDRREEKSGGELSSETMAQWLEVFAEICIDVAICLFGPMFCYGYLAVDLTRMLYILSARSPMGGINNYGCWFGGGPLNGVYIIDYKSDIGEYGTLLDASQQSFIAQLEKEKLQQDKNAKLWGGVMLAGLLAGVGFALSMGGEKNAGRSQ